jgi:hypothetical protein
MVPAASAFTFSHSLTVRPGATFRGAPLANVLGATASGNPSGDMVVIGDSKSPDGPVLAYGRSECSAFVEGIRQRDFEDLLQVWDRCSRRMTDQIHMLLPSPPEWPPLASVADHAG